jgi:uracil-DNA glycosylase
MTLNQQKFFQAIPKSWQAVLSKICLDSKIDQLLAFLKNREQAGAQIYPAKENILAALKATPFDQVRVVIVGQDPYHGYNQAHGLSFSVLPGVPLPPSLKNIFKEIFSDLGITISKGSGNLASWANQGVLLLNAILTVEVGLPASHAKQGWELFTDEILRQLLLRNQPTVFMLWGAYAQNKIKDLQLQIDPNKHLILKAAHPSPLSVRGFLGCKHFSLANQFLKKHNLRQIDWSLS